MLTSVGRFNEKKYSQIMWHARAIRIIQSMFDWGLKFLKQISQFILNSVHIFSQKLIFWLFHLRWRKKLIKRVVASKAHKKRPGIPMTNSTICRHSCAIHLQYNTESYIWSNLFFQLFAKQKRWAQYEFTHTCM